MPNLFNRVVASIFSSYAKPDPSEVTEIEAAPIPENDVAWSERSAMYGTQDFEKYNPDDLINTKGFRIYRKMMLDEQVKAVVRFKRDAVTSRDYYFELDGEKYGLSDEEVERRIKLSECIVENMKGSWVDALNGIMSGVSNGFSLTEIMPKMIEFEGLSYWGLDRLKLKPFDTFRFSVDEFGNVTKTVQRMGGKEQEIDLNKFIHYVVNPDVDEHYGGSELREAYRAWYSKDITIKFRNIYLERHAGGFHTIQPPQGVTVQPGTTLYTSIQDILANINVKTGILLPAGFTMISHYPSNKADYDKAIEFNDTAIARALLVPNLLGVSPQGDVGSYSQSTNQLKAFIWTLKADGDRLDDALNEQLFSKLGRLNFGDEGWPRYRSKPISIDQAVEIVKTWKELVGAGAVTPTDTDEKYIRELFEFPEKGEEEIKKNGPVTALPGSDGAGTDGGQPKNDALPDSQDNPQGNQNASEEDLAAASAAAKDSTIVGIGSVSVSAFSRAMRRVDFAVIAKNSDSITDEYSNKTADTMDLIIQDLIAKAKTGGNLNEDVRNNIAALKVDKQLKRKLNNVQFAMLKEGSKLGIQHASIEIDKAKGEAFSRKVDMGRLDMIAEDYFQTTAFKITGNLSDEAVKIIESEILNGARYDKTWAQVEESIYRTFASRGMITTELAKEALGEALGVNSPDARIRTIVRTSTFDAINNARYSYFTDPGLGGFVKAFEYSAILDSRTTSICRHLDEEDRGNHSVEWYNENSQFRPPNHYNCRSLMIPVTELDIDTFVEGEQPTIDPQEGFK